MELMVRRRSRMDSVPELNRRLVSRLAELPEIWGVGRSPDAIRLVYDDEGEFAGSNFTRSLKADLTGHASYISRFPGWVEPDESSADDFCVFEYSASEYADMTNYVLPSVVKTFDAYRASAHTSLEVRSADWQKICELHTHGSPDLDGRDSVYRIWPANFFDDTLCRRAFGLSAEEVVVRAAPECDDAYVLNGGAFLLVSKEPVSDRDALNALHERVAARLAASSA